MRLPDWLIAPSDQDVAKYIVLPQRCGQTVAGSLANVLVQISFGNIPQDKVLVVTNAVLATDAGAAQTTILMRIIVRLEPAGVEIFELARDELNTPIDQAQLNWTGEIVVFPNERLFFEGSFSAAGAANALSASYHGYLIPRGNFQHGQITAFGA